MSGTQGTHHTTMVLFQNCSEDAPGKPNVSHTRLSRYNCKMTTELPFQLVHQKRKPVDSPILSDDSKTIEDYSNYNMPVSITNCETADATENEFLLVSRDAGLLTIPRK